MSEFKRVVATFAEAFGNDWRVTYEVKRCATKERDYITFYIGCSDEARAELLRLHEHGWKSFTFNVKYSKGELSFHRWWKGLSLNNLPEPKMDAEPAAKRAVWIMREHMKTLGVSEKEIGGPNE